LEKPCRLVGAANAGSKFSTIDAVRDDTKTHALLGHSSSRWRPWGSRVVLFGGRDV
jgi:hypothetical protein